MHNNRHVHSRFVCWQGLCLALSVLLLLLFPSGAFWLQLDGYILLWGVAYTAYRALCPVENLGRYALLCFCTLLAAGQTINVWYFTTAAGGTPTAPVLLNDDAMAAWSQMMAINTGTQSAVHITRQGFGTFLALLSNVLGANIVTLLWVSGISTILAIVLTGATASAVLPKHAARAASVAMIMTGGMAYFLSSGTILIKDALVCLLMAVVLYSLYGTRKPWDGVGPIILVSIVAALVRPNLEFFIIMAALISLYGRGRSALLPVVTVCLICAAMFLWRHSTGTVAEIIDSTDGSSSYLVQGSLEREAKRTAAFTAVAGADYEGSTMLHKITMLPFSLAVQYLTPLPWAFARDAVFGPATSWAHMSFLWYIIGGIILYYVACIGSSPKKLRSIFAFGVIAWIVTALFTGGAVSRYCLPWLPFLAPAGAWVIVSGKWRQKSFKLWAYAYIALIVVALVAVFAALHKYSPDGWEVI